MRVVAILILVVIPFFGVAQDFSIHAVDENGKEFPDTLDIIPPLIKVKISSQNASKKFRFEKAQVILSRQKSRWAAIDYLSSNIDLGLFYRQTRPGDHLVLNISIEESINDKPVKTHTRVLDYFLTGKTSN
jgi:hypothetical protein